MQSRLFRFAIPAVLAASIPAAAVLAQSQAQPPAAPRGPSSEVQARLQDGRIAMIKEALKLNNDQLKLWGPVEEQLRASFKARQDARAERRERREQGAQRPTLPDRLDHASKRMAERAERMRSFAETVKPLYASLSEDQKAVAAVVLRRPLGMGEGRGQRWAMHRGHRPDQK
jgi:hypothetical protein